MECKFCKQERKLIEAHIIPYSFFKPILNEHKPGIFSSDPKESKKITPKGVYDKNLVCEDCEKLFTQYDDYAKRFFLNELKNKILEPEEFEGQAVVVKEFDYKKLKLFLISLLWRASSSNHKFFQQINVGPFEPKLKQMIQSNVSGSPEEFPILFKIFFGNGADKQMMSPTRVKIEGRNYYRFYLAGICAQIKVDSQPVPKNLKDFILNPETPIIMMKQNILESHELSSFYSNLSKKAGKKYHL